MTIDFSLRPLDLAVDLDLLHAWVTAPRARFWQMQGMTRDEVASAYRRLTTSGHHDVLLGVEADGTPGFLLERYDPAQAEIGQVYDVLPGDVGMHLLVAPADRPRPGYTSAVFRAAVAHLFTDPATQRIVVEPDVANLAVHRRNAEVGFGVVGVVELPDKLGLLSVLDRSRRPDADDAAAQVAHLSPGPWQESSRDIVRKALAEFAHEGLITPVPAADDTWAVTTDDGHVYRFAAQVMALHHWRIDPATLTCHTPGGDLVALDAQDLVIRLRPQLGLSDEDFPVYLEEMAATVASGAWKLIHRRTDARDLAVADFEVIERSMTAGHPCFVATNGRLGLDAKDYLEFSPEAAEPVRLQWIAVRKDASTFAVGAGMDEEQLMASELGPAVRERFDRSMRAQGLDPSHYRPMPVHPWQWRNRIAVTFAPDIAARRLVPLGPGEDLYRPQQSVRTFLNITDPSRHYVKTALSVLNMGFLRGLSTSWMASTPAINDWLVQLLEGDEVMARSRFGILRERAAVGFHPSHYEGGVPPGSPYLKMLAALWRESPQTRLQPGERLMTMAALLHVDAEGRSLAAALVERSGLPATHWVRSYLKAYLTPLLHCFWAHRLVFMPHGENVILVLRDDVVTRVIMKDIAEEIALLRTPGSTVADGLPPGVERVVSDTSDDHAPLALLTDVVDCFLRFLAAELVAAEQIGEDEFWPVVAQVVQDYQDGHPEFAERFDRWDLFAPRFGRSCLNRLQLANNRQMLDLLTGGDEALQIVGTLENPLARHRPSPGPDPRGSGEAVGELVGQSTT